MERRLDTLALSSRHVGIFFVTCALHVSAIYYASDHLAAERASLLGTLQVSFIPAVKPSEPPPPPPIPILLADAFAERQLMQIPAPDVNIVVPAEPRAIRPPASDPPSEPLDVLEEHLGYGPLTRPRVLSGPKSQDRYPRASIRHRESGRTIVKICISPSGTVESVSVAESSGYGRLDEAAVDISWDYKFAPAMRDGQAVAVCLPYSIRFRIATGGGARARR